MATTLQSELGWSTGGEERRRDNGIMTVRRNSGRVLELPGEAPDSAALPFSSCLSPSSITGAGIYSGK